MLESRGRSNGKQQNGRGEGVGIDQLGTVKMKLPQTLDIHLAVTCFSYKINLAGHRSMEDAYPTRAIIFPSVK